MTTIPPLRTPNNKYYSGMTLAEAKELKLDNKAFGRDFYDLDRNWDGVLSVDEIIHERERKARHYHFATLAFIALTAYDITRNRTSGVDTFFNLLIDVYLVASSVIKAKRTNEVTEKYKAYLSKMNNSETQSYINYTF